jgi:AcrR family transcriptional regulator
LLPAIFDSNVMFDNNVKDDPREVRLVGVKQFDEAKALADALEVFWRQGVAATSMLDLAHATGIQRGSLYNAYGDKEAIFLRAFDLYAERFLESVRRSLNADNPEAALAGFFEAAIANMTAGSPSRGCLTTKTANDGSAASPKVRQKLRCLLDTLTVTIERAMSRKNIRDGLTLTPQETAKIVVAFTRGLAVMERVYGRRDNLTETAAALVKSLVHKPSTSSSDKM